MNKGIYMEPKKLDDLKWSQADLAEHEKLLAWQSAQIWEFIEPGVHAVIETHITNGKIARVVSKKSSLPPKNFE